MVYRKGASPNRVPDALTPKNHRISLKNAVYVRAAEGRGALPHAPITILLAAKLH
ncbi:hypothetical protein [uncultured Helicobacter sp.]|uniref:hypothetical protein n=1 Tax=uncultured Helicobacter sp. TaxID=175537 RepID=UPI003750266F